MAEETTTQEAQTTGAQTVQQEIPETLTPQQAIGLLIQAVEAGQKAGVYSLSDAALLDKAVKTFVKPAEAQATESAEAEEAGVETVAQ